MASKHEVPLPGTLVLAGSPIGDVADASPHLVQVLTDADIVAAEDTRRFHRLCDRLGITVTGRVVSYFDGNEAERTPGLVEAMLGGATVVVVTDAGMPSVSDPGYRLVRACLDAGIEVVAVPGPSAALTALAVSGLPVRRFCFEGFPPRKAGERASYLAGLAREPRTMVFFEAPHRLGEFLGACVTVFGGGRAGAICRELTKPHQEVVRGPLDELAEWAKGPVLGEVSVVIGGWQGLDGDAAEDALAAGVTAVRQAVDGGATTRAAVAMVAAAQGLRRKALYDAVVAPSSETIVAAPPDAAPATNIRAVDIASVLVEHGFADLPPRLPRPVIDSHTHLDAVFEKTGLTAEENLAAAASVGVTKVVQIGCDVESSRWAVDFAAAHPQVVAAVAVHPNDAARLTVKELEAAIAEIDALAGAGRHVRAVGETGLDYYRTRDAAGQTQQRESFADHIAIAAARGLTLAIHDREAHNDILRLLDDAPVRPERVIMHCFSGGMALARECAERGYWLSFPGTVTFKGSDDLRDALLVTPLDRLLVETDAPYLTPVPARGKPNASCLVAHTAAFIAEHRGDDLAVLCDALTANAEAAYGGAWGSAA